MVNIEGKERCPECKRRLRLLTVTCKCGLVTCIKCRWPDHNCDFDFQKEAKEQLKKENPVVAPKKITPI